MKSVLCLLTLLAIFVLTHAANPRLPTQIKETRYMNFPTEDDPSTPADESKFVTPCNCRPDPLNGDLICVFLGEFDPSYTISGYRGLGRIHSSVVNN
jgi:hypothetical protein